MWVRSHNKLEKKMLAVLIRPELALKKQKTKFTGLRPKAPGSAATPTRPMMLSALIVATWSITQPPTPAPTWCTVEGLGFSVKGFRPSLSLLR
jgi:hypothetical protein